MKTQYTEAQKAEALEILTDDGFFEVMTLEDFMTGYKPWQVARMVKQSGLNLDCKYIRINGYYYDVQEANKMTDLISDDEVKETLWLDDSPLLELDTSRQDNEVYTKATTETAPLYLGTLELVDGVWYLVGALEDGDLVTGELKGDRRSEALKALSDELKSLSSEVVQKLKSVDPECPGGIICLLSSDPVLWYDL